MSTITIDEIMKDLKQFLFRVKTGETLIIVDAEKPFAEIKPLNPDSQGALFRPFGLCSGKIKIAEDFDSPLPEEILRDFDGK